MKAQEMRIGTAFRKPAKGRFRSSGEVSSASIDAVTYGTEGSFEYESLKATGTSLS